MTSLKKCLVNGHDVVVGGISPDTWYCSSCDTEKVSNSRKCSSFSRSDLQFLIAIARTYFEE